VGVLHVSPAAVRTNVVQAGATFALNRFFLIKQDQR
jgi:hypothetical protein